MHSAEVFEQIEKMGGLPSLPQTLLNVQQVAANDRSNAEDLAQCILKDQALTLRVLKVVNSALYQRRGKEKIVTVRRAVIVMGFETVRKLALGLSVFDMMSKLSRSPRLVDIARHSLITAGFAQALAEAAGSVPPEEAFVTALIHDVGKVVLVECSPEAMDAVMADVAAGQSELDAERYRFGITHDRAGRRLAARWQLPPELVNVIGDHHDLDPANPPRQVDPHLGVIVFANAMSHFGEAGSDPETEQRILRKAVRRLGIPSHRLEEIQGWVRDGIRDLASCIGLDPEDLGDYGSLVNVEGGVNVAPRQMTPAEVARRTAEQLELYRAIGGGLAAGEDRRQLLGLILQGAVEILGFQRVLLFAVDRPGHRLRPWLWAGDGAEQLAGALDLPLALPLARSTGALALAVLERRMFHVPDALNPAYGELAGRDLLKVAGCRGFVAAPVAAPEGPAAVLYGDCGSQGADVGAAQASELAGLALQAGLVLLAREPLPAA